MLSNCNSQKQGDSRILWKNIFNRSWPRKAYFTCPIAEGRTSVWCDHGRGSKLLKKQEWQRAESDPVEVFRRCRGTRWPSGPWLLPWTPVRSTRVDKGNWVKRPSKASV